MTRPRRRRPQSRLRFASRTYAILTSNPLPHACGNRTLTSHCSTLFSDSLGMYLTGYGSVGGAIFGERTQAGCNDTLIYAKYKLLRFQRPPDPFIAESRSSFEWLPIWRGTLATHLWA